MEGRGVGDVDGTEVCIIEGGEEGRQLGINVGRSVG